MNFVLIFCNSTAGRLIYAYSHYICVQEVDVCIKLVMKNLVYL